MKRWTRDARDYEYNCEVATSTGQQIGQSLLYANALDVVKSTDKDLKAGEILTRHLNLARKEIQALKSAADKQIITSDEDITAASSNEEDNSHLSAYDSDGQPVVRNVYGASGSSAYMSDVDLNQIRAPLVPTETGRRRETRFKPVFERKRKGRKRYTAGPILCENCGEEGHVSSLCIGNEAPPVLVATKKKGSKKRQDK